MSTTLVKPTNGATNGNAVVRARINGIVQHARRVLQDDGYSGVELERLVSRCVEVGLAAGIGWLPLARGARR